MAHSFYAGLWDTIASIEVPKAILLAGEESDTYPEPWLETLAERLKSVQDLKSKRVDKLGHLLVMESPALTASYLAQLLHENPRL